MSANSLNYIPDIAIQPYIITPTETQTLSEHISTLRTEWKNYYEEKLNKIQSTKRVAVYHWLAHLCLEHPLRIYQPPIGNLPLQGKASQTVEIPRRSLDETLILPGNITCDQCTESQEEINTCVTHLEETEAYQQAVLHLLDQQALPPLATTDLTIDDSLWFPDFITQPDFPDNGGAQQSEPGNAQQPPFQFISPSLITATGTPSHGTSTDTPITPASLSRDPSERITHPGGTHTRQGKSHPVPTDTLPCPPSTLRGGSANGNVSFSLEAQGRTVYSK